MDWDKIIAENMCKITPDGSLVHPGLPFYAGGIVWVLMLAIIIWHAYTPIIPGARGLNDTVGASKSPQNKAIITRLPFTNFFRITLPGLIPFSSFLSFFHQPWLIISLKFVTVSLFLLVIWSGLLGTSIPEHNLATVLTWNIWWSAVILFVVFAGSAWCAICPWDSLASWLVNRRLWKRSPANKSLNLRVPKALRTLWPAFILFIAMTWLELGFGITSSPYATAMLAIFVLGLALLFMVIFERKSFCRFACPVGRTIGFYSQLAPVELRPKKTDICASCTTLECYHGSKTINPCPTHQLMGTMTQNTFCISCGNCMRSCPDQNVGWRLRPPATEALQDARPHWDEAWFILILMVLTSFHGLTMMPLWEGFLKQIGTFLGEGGQLLWSFSIGMMIAMAVPVLFYSLMVWLTQNQRLFSQNAAITAVSFQDIFIRLSFIALPLAFSYHLAHNLVHLLREMVGSSGVFANPMGIGTKALSLLEKYERMNEAIMAPMIVIFCQIALMTLGFLFAVFVVRTRGVSLFKPDSADHSIITQKAITIALMPALLFVFLINSYHLWLLMQPMVIRL